MAGPYDFEEQERIAAIHHWWEDNAKYVYVSVAAFVLSVAGWRGWNYWTQSQAEEAATMAAEMRKARGDPKRYSDYAQAVMEKFPRSFYASEAALASARASFDKGELAAAQARLEWVLKSGREEYRGIARVRLAAVLLDQKKYSEALEILDANKDEAYVPLVADLKGDVLLAQGRNDEARAAYKLALERSEARSPMRGLVELKLGALGGPK